MPWKNMEFRCQTNSYKYFFVWLECVSFELRLLDLKPRSNWTFYTPRTLFLFPQNINFFPTFFACKATKNFFQQRRAFFEYWHRRASTISFLTFALVIIESTSPQHHLLSKTFSWGWKSFRGIYHSALEGLLWSLSICLEPSKTFRGIPTFYSKGFGDRAYFPTEELQLHPLSQAVLKTTKIATHNCNINCRRQPNPSEYYDASFSVLSASEKRI
jgi:hypothetical protein